MEVSVIIPTYKRHASLLKTLNSLQNQSATSYELIVVDNSTDDELPSLISDFNVSAKIPVRYARETRLGSHHARHLGARLAKGRLFAFTDDDVTLHARWVEAYQKAFSEHPEMKAAGGPSLPLWESAPPSWLLTYIDGQRTFEPLSLTDRAREFQLSPREYFWSLNMAIRSDVLFEVGGFNPDLLGQVLIGDGETGLCRKLWERGMLIGYIPQAVVYHRVPSERMTLEYLRRRMANEGRSDAYSQFHHAIPGRAILVKTACRLIISKAKYIVAGLVLRGRKDRLSLIAQLQSARVYAQLQYIVGLIFDKRVRELFEAREILSHEK